MQNYKESIKVVEETSKGVAQFSKNFVFPCFSHCLSVPFQTSGGEFLKTERGFCWEQSHSQKPLSFLHRYHGLGESKRSLRPFFHKFTKCSVFPYFSHCLWAHFLNSWR
jgi:hypothetical protein